MSDVDWRTTNTKLIRWVFLLSMAAVLACLGVVIAGFYHQFSKFSDQKAEVQEHIEDYDALIEFSRLVTRAHDRAAARCLTERERESAQTLEGWDAFMKKGNSNQSFVHQDALIILQTLDAYGVSLHFLPSSGVVMPVAQYFDHAENGRSFIISSHVPDDVKLADITTFLTGLSEANFSIASDGESKSRILIRHENAELTEVTVEISTLDDVKVETAGGSYVPAVSVWKGPCG